MKIKNKNIKKLLEKYKEIALLGKINAILAWDLNVNLPEEASDGRAKQTSYITKLITEKWLDPDFKNLLKEIDGKGLSLTVDEKAIVRNLKQEGKLYFNVPKRVIIEFSETTSKAFMVWQKAKKKDDFEAFLPHLEKLVSLNQTIAEKLGFDDNPYDALLDLFEPSFTYGKGKKIFGKLQPELTKLLKKIQKSKNYKQEIDFLGEEHEYPIEVQKKLSEFAINKIGYDTDAGRMDVSSHPFTETLGRFDVRITNRYDPHDFRESLMVAMHEGGHALYEQGVSPDYQDTPLDGGVSLGVHESQSRFWENQIGRSYEFIKFITPVLKAFFPDELSKETTESIFAAFNQVKPSFIRTEADEVTYNLHIILRFEIEEGLVNGKIKPKDLPDVWREKMKKYLGVVPKTDREGVLQDVHWSHAPMGYFPTYTLGNLYAAQFAEATKKKLDVNKLIEKGDLQAMLAWQRKDIHQHGSLYWPDELVKKVTGEKLNEKYFLDYVKDKYTKIYNL